MNRRTIGFLLAAVCVQGLASAGPLVKSQVAASAEWVIHIDVHQLNHARIGTLVQGSNAPAQLQESIAVCQQDLGFHPLRDLEQITLYGESADGQDGVALLRGAVKQDKITATLRKNTSYQTIAAGRRTLHQWSNPRDQKTVTMCFFREDLMVLATSQPLVERALDVLDGKVASLKTGGRVVLPAAEGILVAAMTKGAGELPGLGGSVDSATAVLLETKEGLLNLDLNLAAKDEKEATKMQQTGQVLVISALAMADQNPDLATLARNTSITGTGKTVTVQIRYPADQALALLQKGMVPPSSPTPKPAPTP